MPARRLPEGKLALPRAKDAPPDLTTRTSDEYVYGQDIFRVAALRAKSGQTGGASKIMDLVGDVDTRRQESLRETGTRSIPDEAKTYGTFY